MQRASSRPAPAPGASSRQAALLRHASGLRTASRPAVRGRGVPPGKQQQHLCARLNCQPATQAAAAAELVVPTPDLMVPKYCESIHQARRRPTRTVTVRGLMAGRHGAHGARTALRARQALAGRLNC